MNKFKKIIADTELSRIAMAYDASESATFYVPNFPEIITKKARQSLIELGFKLNTETNRWYKTLK